MKNLFYLKSEKNESYLFFGMETFGGEEGGGLDALPVESESLSFSSEEVENIIENLDNTLEKYGIDSDFILDQIKNSGVITQEEIEQIEADMEEKLIELGFIDVDVELTVKSAVVSTKEIRTNSSSIDPEINSLDSFPNGKDDLQILLGEKNKNKKKPYVEKDGIMINGVLDETQGISLSGVLRDDLGGPRVNVANTKNGDLQMEQKKLNEVVQNAQYLLDAIKNTYPNAQTTLVQAKVLFDAMSGNISTSLDIQDALGSIDESWAESVNGLDNKYGENTRLTVRKLGLALAKVVEEYVETTTTVTRDIDIQVNAKKELSEGGASNTNRKIKKNKNNTSPTRVKVNTNHNTTIGKKPNCAKFKKKTLGELVSSLFPKTNKRKKLNRRWGR